MKCPGKYCGIRTESGSNSSYCGPCPWSYRVNPNSYNCEPCRQDLLWHDYMYLAFVTVVPVMVHSIYHEFTVGRVSTSKLWPIYYIFVFLETAISIIFSILLLPPSGWFQVYACGANELSDWYPMFNNPTVHSQETLHCTQEVVYPLYSLPFIFFAIWFFFSVIIRPLLGLRLNTEAIGKIGPSLYFCPIVVIVHAICAGLIYYSFPYLVIIISLVVNALLLANFPVQTIRGIISAIYDNPRQLFLIFSLLMVNVLGVLSLFNSTPKLGQIWVFFLIPTPVLFYIITVPFTDPAKLSLSTH